MTTDTVERLTAALVQEQRAARIDQPGSHGEGVGAEGIAVVLAKDHWGSVGLVGLVRADGLAEAGISQRAAAFDALVRSLHRYAGVLTLFTRYGAASVKLGSFGVLAFVFESGCSPALVSVVRRQRRGSAARKEYTLCWTIDVPAGRVHDHGFLPRGVFPPKRWVEGVIRRS